LVLERILVGASFHCLPSAAQVFWNRRRRSDFRRDLPTKDIFKKLLHGKSPLLTFALRFPGWVMDSVYSGLTDN